MWTRFRIMESLVSSGVAVLDKVMAIMHAYRRGESRLQPRTVAERTGISLPTVYRLMNAMELHQLLERNGSAFRPGVAMLHLGATAADTLDLRQAVLPHLRGLRDELDENAEMHVRRGAARVAVEVVLSSQNLRPFVEVGARFPLHVGASGRALLAWMPVKEVLDLALASRENFTPDAEFDERRFMDGLRRTRQRGWAESDGERSHGVAAVSAPVFDAAGEVAATVVLSGPSQRLPARKRRHLAPAVTSAAQAASRDAGFRWDRPVRDAAGGGGPT